MTINKFGRNSFITWTAEDLRKEREAEMEKQMGEIKFRAWDTRRQKMWSPEEMGKDQLTLSPDGRGFVNVNGMSTKFSQWMSHLVPEQFTGFKDKNGKGDEIYKDDIVSSFNDVNYLVYYDTEYGQWWGRIINKTKGKYTRPLCEILDNSYMKIIGDIHTTPKLME